MDTGILLSTTYEGWGRFNRGQGNLSLGAGRARGRALPLRPRRAAAPVRGLVHRLPAARGAAGHAPRPAVAVPDADLHPGRAAHDRGASRPRAAARRVRHPAWRPALRPRPDHARGRAVRHPGGAAAAGRAGAARPAGRRARRARPAGGGRPRRRVRRTARPGQGGGRLAGTVRGAGRDPAAAAAGPRRGRPRPGGPRGPVGLAAAAPGGRRGAGGRPGRRDRLERPTPE